MPSLDLDCFLRVNEIAMHSMKTMDGEGLRNDEGVIAGLITKVTEIVREDCKR